MLEQEAKSHALIKSLAERSDQGSKGRVGSSPRSVGGRFEPRLNLGSSQIVVIVGFGTWVPGLVEPGFQNLSSRTQVRTSLNPGQMAMMASQT